MEGENNTETVKIDIRVSGKGSINCGKDKISCTVEDGGGKRLLQWNSEPESWIDQVKHIYRTPDYEKLQTSPDVSIYRVPESIKNTKRGAYDPLVLFLGPYHHNKHQPLTAMDKYKLKAVDKTLERLRMTMDKLHEKGEGLMDEIRKCYEDSAREWDDVTLVWMMTMDACFILEFLRMDMPNSSLVFHVNRGHNIKRREIMLDILKLENQIPFCILKMILKLEFKETAKLQDFLTKLLSPYLYFQGYPFSRSSGEEDIAKHIQSGPLHLLDLSRRVIADFLSNSASDCPSSCSFYDCKASCGASTCIATPNAVACFRGEQLILPPRSLATNNIPSAEKLQRVGIKLQLSSEGKFDFKRRSFGRSTLFLPLIIVDDYTEIFLRNLVAFEESQRHDGSLVKRVISRNMCIMDNLIDSKEDVGLFRRAQIIENYLGTDEEVAQIFNDLCFGISYKDDFKDVLEMINKHYKSQWNVLITEFRNEHCSRPWYIVSFVAAALLLVMTFLQTIYTMKGYFQS